MRAICIKHFSLLVANPGGDFAKICGLLRIYELSRSFKLCPSSIIIKILQALKFRLTPNFITYLSP